jgi:hypothetical protein
MADKSLIVWSLYGVHSNSSLVCMVKGGEDKCLPVTIPVQEEQWRGHLIL